MAIMQTCNIETSVMARRRLASDSMPLQALIGFDGYVDMLYRVVKYRNSKGAPVFYQNIASYGRRILKAGGRSAEVDLHVKSKRFGGNAPLMADGMAALGDSPVLIGALGYPEIKPCFDMIHANVLKISYANPCMTIALEFDDGKIMMGDAQNSGEICWTNLSERVKDEVLMEKLAQTELIAILNWSAHAGMGEIARKIAGFLRQDQMLFLDISDPVSLPHDRLKEVLNNISFIAHRQKAVLGLNENEASAVLQTVFPRIDKRIELRELASQFGERLRQVMGLSCITIHANTYAMGFDENGSWICEGFYVDRPCFLTGAGDHYNAAFCSAYARQWPLQQCLMIACAASACFVCSGDSPNRLAIDACLKAFIDKAVN